jgi:hypothetical protein
MVVTSVVVQAVCGVLIAVASRRTLAWASAVDASWERAVWLPARERLGAMVSSGMRCAGLTPPVMSTNVNAPISRMCLPFRMEVGRPDQRRN